MTSDQKSHTLQVVSPCPFAGGTTQPPTPISERARTVTGFLLFFMNIEFRPIVEADELIERAMQEPGRVMICASGPFRDYLRRAVHDRGLKDIHVATVGGMVAGWSCETAMVCMQCITDVVAEWIYYHVQTRLSSPNGTILVFGAATLKAREIAMHGRPPTGFDRP